MACIMICSFSVSGCTGEQEKKEKGAIEQGTKKVAKEAVQAIKTPLEQAHIAAEQETNHSREVEQAQKP